jgi:flagellar biosynthesis component FlhA
MLAELPTLSPAFVVVLLLACVMVPLPQVLVDLLLSLSLAGSLLLVAGALRVRRPSQFVTFPNLLILVTLFRIALNLSTTRLILSEADAGRVIDAFSGAVVRDDLIVGAVMFLIITTIQYLVIARGTERVAEVGARFALDGMPGRQSAIDAALRSGSISPREASRRRAELDARSSFFGAMDGASRYVRGDAIAGLIIIGINLVGGVAVGTIRADLGVRESLELYGRLTIGDGLMAQIPAVLVSLAAGLLVSRVEVDDRVRTGWFEPTMLWIPAALLIGLALVPGMPTAAFGFTGVGLVAASVVIARATPSPDESPSTAPRMISMQVPSSMAREARRLSRAAVGVRNEVSARLGFRCPPIDVRADGKPRSMVLRTPDAARIDLPLPQETVDVVVVAAYRALIRSADRLIDARAIESWLEAVRASHPTVAEDAMRAIDRVELLGLARGLAREGVPIPSPVVLLSALAEHPAFGQTSERPRWLARLREVLSATWVPDMLADRASGASIRWVRPTPDLETAMAGPTVLVGGRLEATVAPVRRRAVARRFVGSDDGPGPIVLTSAARREAVSAWLRDTGAVVLAVTELDAAGVSRPQAVSWRDESILDDEPPAPAVESPAPA